MKLKYSLSYTLKSLLVLIVGAILFSNWYFIASVVLQDAMMGSGLFAFGIAGIATFLLSIKLFNFKKKWIISLILTALSFFLGRVIEENNLTYRDSNFYLNIQEENQIKRRANELKSEKGKLARDAIESKIYDDHILSLITYLETQDKYEYVSAGQVSHDYVLIYPEDLRLILSPITVKPYNQQAYLRYFVLSKNRDSLQVHSNELFEWNYLDQNDFKNTAVGPNLMEQLNTLTEWNFSSKKIDDLNFWDRYVLAKENGGYKYLEKVDLNEK